MPAKTIRFRPRGAGAETSDGPESDGRRLAGCPGRSVTGGEEKQGGRLEPGEEEARRDLAPRGRLGSRAWGNGHPPSPGAAAREATAPLMTRRRRAPIGIAP